MHLIQVALTPVFLLSGIAALLNVYASRHAKVSDRLVALTPADHEGRPIPQASLDELARLHRRSVVLDWAVVLGTVGAAATCMAILTLFLIALSQTSIAGALVAFFGVAIVCTLASVATFGLEMLLASQAIRSQIRLHWPHLTRHRRGP